MFQGQRSLVEADAFSSFMRNVNDFSGHGLEGSL